jgi:nicotinamidase-related amidase
MTAGPDPWGPSRWSNTALVLLDLMPRLIELPLEPRSGASVLAACARLAHSVEQAGGHVILVRTERPGVAQPPGSGIAPPLHGPHRQVVVKRTIGAVHRTSLRQELARRRAHRLILAGLMTNLAVESAGRAASDHGWRHLIFVEDAMSALSCAEHAASVYHSLPRFGAVLTANEVARVAGRQGARPDRRPVDQRANR